MQKRRVETKWSPLLPFSQLTPFPRAQARAAHAPISFLHLSSVTISVSFPFGPGFILVSFLIVSCNGNKVSTFSAPTVHVSVCTDNTVHRILTTVQTCVPTSCWCRSSGIPYTHPFRQSLEYHELSHGSAALAWKEGCTEQFTTKTYSTGHTELKRESLITRKCWVLDLRGRGLECEYSNAQMFEGWCKSWTDIGVFGQN